MVLQTTRNTKSVERKVRGAFREKFHRRYFTTFFEHGQWFVQFEDESGEYRTYSVVDSLIGFDFEALD